MFVLRSLTNRYKQRSPKSMVKKAWNNITTVIVTIVVIAAVLLVGVRLIGLQVFSVLSGSMEPTYHVGSVIYVKKVDPFEIKEGQVITFMMNDEVVATHRVVGVVPDDDDPSTIRFRTKGDANTAEDSNLVHYKNVIGVPVFTVPYLGYVANYIQNPPGTYIAVSAAAVLLMLMVIPDFLAKDSKKNSEKAENVK